MSAAPGEGVALLDATLANGTIELELRGKDMPQQSFLGVAFHAIDGTTFDCVYFRPFNFKASDAAARSHAVQYHAIPRYSWATLRADHPGQYEQPISPVPDPNAWFRARIVVANPKVQVYVDGAAAPCLSVETLSGRTSGRVGLWVGNNSGGDFANLSITPA